MDAIYAIEAEAIVNKTAGVETSLALLSSIIELAMGTVEIEDQDDAIEKPEKAPKPKDKPTPPAKEKKPEPEKKKKAVKNRKPAKAKKVEPKKEDTSSDNQ